MPSRIEDGHRTTASDQNTPIQDPHSDTPPLTLFRRTHKYHALNSNSQMESVAKIIGEANIKQKLIKAYRALKEEKVYGVMGNPSCDQDSFLGSLALSLSLNRVPIVNLSKRIFNCKGDLVRLVADMGIAAEDLLFVETGHSGHPVIMHGDTEYPISKFIVALIDHNKPSIDVLVDKVIDHHPLLDESIYQLTSKESVEIELHAGSCCSLIFREIEKMQAQGDNSFLILLAIPILTDTSLLTRRTNPIDREAVEKLLSMAGLERRDLYAYVTMLKKEKQSEHRIEGDLILLMDYKSFGCPGEERTFGISSVGYSIEAWVKRDTLHGFISTVNKFIRERNHLFLLINAKTKGCREYVITAADGKEHEDFVKETFYDGASPVFTEIEDGGEAVKVYRVDRSLSRKLYAPKAHKYLETFPF